MGENLYTIEVPTPKVREMIAAAMAQIQKSRDEARKKALRYKAEFIALKRRKWFRNRALDRLSDEAFWATFNVPDYWVDGVKSPCVPYSTWAGKARHRHDYEARIFLTLLQEIDTYQSPDVRMTNSMLEMLTQTYYFEPRTPKHDPMRIPTLLQHTAQARKDTLLAAILSAAFETDNGELDLGKEPPTDLGGLLARETEKLLALAETNLETIAAVDTDAIGESALDDSIHDIFSDQASEVNNNGATGQIRCLVVEHGWTAENIRTTAAADENAPLREIPED